MTKPTKSASKKRTTAALTLSSYLDDSRDLFGSMLLVLPLFLLYQVGVLVTGGIRNGVDFVTDMMWWAAGGQLWSYLMINLGILVAFGIALAVLRDKGTFKPKIWPWVIAESTVYASLLGTAVVLMMSTVGLDVLLSTGASGEYGFVTKVVLSIGAGLYEETVFRLILMGGMFVAAVRWLKLSTWVSAAGAVVLSSVIFSLVHYIGPLGDPFALGSFFFRFFAGILLAGIFYLRGFAVAVYTHAIYDIFVMVFY